MALEFVCGVFASVVVQEFIDTIKSFGCDQFRHVIADVEKKLQALEMSYVKAHSMLDKVDGWELISSKPHREWVGDVKRACYDIEDLIANVVGEMRKTQNALSFLKNWIVSREIDEQQQNLDALLEKASNLVTLHSMEYSRNTVGSEPLTEFKPFTRESEKDEIIKMLFRSTTFGRSSSAANSSRSGRGTTGVIVSIEGMLGIGKTLLAHMIKKDIKIQRLFHQKFWVNLSGNFNLAEVLRSIMIQADMEEFQEKQQLEVKLKSFSDWCKGKRIFIVIDDLCNFLNLQDWEQFESLLHSTLAFAILVTTRNPKVTKSVTSISNVPVITHYLKGLSVENCQSIILGENLLSASDTDNLSSKRKRLTQKQTALEIAERFCEGLPLVANVIKLHLYSEPEGRLSNILRRDLWEMPVFRQHIFSAFRLNYSDISQPLKNCFCYLSLFPIDYNFKKEDLVQYWIAEGLITQGHPGESHYTAGSLEEMGNNLFDELLLRSIIVYEHEPIVYKMHKFIYRYAQYVSSDLYLQIDKQFIDAYSSLSNGMPSSIVISPTWFSKSRHVSLISRNITPQVLKDLEKCKGLRTLVTIRDHIEIKELAYGLFSKLQSLRVLNLSATYINELPGSIGNLKNLRLLDVSRTNVEELPISISKLTILQVLRLTSCHILELPRDMQKLTNLVHLEVDKFLSCMPPHIGKLTKLQTLPAFIVGTKDGCRITELNNLKQLQGSICLTKLENVGDKDEAKKAMLGNKRFIKRLELGWIKDTNDTRLQAKGVLKRLEPHRDLEELKVIGYGGAKFPNWLSRPECKLTSIHLRRCYGCRSLPILGQIPYLKALHIQEMYMVRYVDDEFSGGASNFPVLELLILQDMENLKKWQGTMLMPRLRDLRILGCPVLHALPCLNRLAALINLEIKDCAALQSLPDGIMPLSLKQLIIEDSDLLKQRCLQEGGADWCKISLVPRVVIDFVPIETLTSYTIHEVDHQ